jgi:NAD-dependent dihydropyrimidine dehydrogenase PreA subunit
MILIDFGRCNACGACVDACKEGAILLQEKRPQVDASLCTLCGDCEDACPEGAIVIGEKHTAITTPRTQPEAEIEVKTSSQTDESALARWAGFALALADRWLVPRIVEEAINRLDQRLRKQGGEPTAEGSDERSARLRGRGRGRHRRTRRRGR